MNSNMREIETFLEKTIYLPDKICQTVIARQIKERAEMKKPEKKLNPYTKRHKVDTRVDKEEFELIQNKSRLYTNGNLSEYVRLACLNYKPRRSL